MTRLLDHVITRKRVYKTLFDTVSKGQNTSGFALVFFHVLVTQLFNH